MSRRLFLALLIVLGILFPVSIFPERGGGGQELAGDGWSPPSREGPKDYARSIDSIAAMAAIAVTKGFESQ